MKAILSLLAAALVPACTVYGEELFSGSNPQQSAEGGMGGKVEENGGAGGETSSSGGSSIGGAPGGADSGTGGAAPVCKGTFTGIATSSLIDDFDSSTRQASGDYPGYWASYGNATGLLPSQDSTWVYDQDECLNDGDTSLHVTGTGYTSWAFIVLTIEGNFDATAFDGIVFWGRSGGAINNSVRFATHNLDVQQTVSTYKSLSKSGWKQYKIPFPADVVRDQVTEFKLVIDAAATFDFWIDDLSFYGDAL